MSDICISWYDFDDIDFDNRYNFFLLFVINKWIIISYNLRIERIMKLDFFFIKVLFLNLDVFIYKYNNMNVFIVI